MNTPASTPTDPEQILLNAMFLLGNPHFIALTVEQFFMPEKRDAMLRDLVHSTAKDAYAIQFEALRCLVHYVDNDELEGLLKQFMKNLRYKEHRVISDELNTRLKGTHKNKTDVTRELPPNKVIEDFCSLAYSAALSHIHTMQANNRARSILNLH